MEGPNKLARLHKAINKFAKKLYPEIFKDGDQGGDSCPSYKQKKICSNGTITVKNDQGAEFPAYPGEPVCITDTFDSNGARRVFFEAPPEGYAFVPSPESNLCPR